MNTRLLFGLLWLTPTLCFGALSTTTSYFLNVEALTNLTARSAVFANSGVVTNNIASIISAGDATFVNVLKASQTNILTGTLTFAHATNGINGAELTHVRTLISDGGGDRTVNIPAAWIKGTGATASFVVTNNTQAKLYVNCTGPTDTAANQTNIVVTLQRFPDSGVADVATSGFGDGTAGSPSIFWTSDNDGTGTGFYRSAANSITASLAGTARWTFNASGHLVGFTDNQVDIGQSGANRPKDVYIADDLTVGDAVDLGNTSVISWSGRTRLSSPASSIFLLTDSAGTAFNRLDFGGTSSSFPAIQRSTTNLIARLADDSASTAVQGTGFGSTSTVASVPIAATGWTNIWGINATVFVEGTGVTFVIYNSAGTASFTNVATVAFATIPLPKDGAVVVTAGSGVTGRAVPW